MIAGVLLAAGNSSRMGRPKAMLSYNGISFIDTILNNLSEIKCRPIITILGESADLICRQTNVNKYKYYNNPDPDRGMLSSIQIAVKKLPQDCSGFMLTLVDHPVVKLQTYRLLKEEALKSPDYIIIPEVNGKHGHPLYFGKPFYSYLINTPDGQSAKDIIKSHLSRVIYIPVDDEGVLRNINTQDDYKKIINDSVEKV